MIMKINERIILGVFVLLLIGSWIFFLVDPIEKSVAEENNPKGQYSSLEEVAMENISIKKIECVDPVQKDIELIGKMTGLRELQLYNLTGEIDLSPLEGLIDLEKISLSVLYGELDTRPLAKLQQLKEIYIEGGEIDYAFLKELNNVETLTTNRNGIENLNFFAHMKKLERLSLHCVFNADFRQLENLEKLSSLELYVGDDLENIECLGNLSSLSNLKVENGSLHNENLVNLEFLKGLKSLRSLNLINIEVESIKPVEELNLKALSLSNVINAEGGLELESIGKLGTLEYLCLKNMTLSSVEPLHKLDSLEDLMLDNVDVECIEPLKELVSLKYLRISGNISEQVKEQAELYFSHVERVEIWE